MRKLSKSDLPDQKSVDFWAWWANRPLSQHFAVGTKVKTAHNPPAEILEVVVHDTDTLLRIRYEDGRIELIKPIALN
jgi:hypothetical protein